MLNAPTANEAATESATAIVCDASTLAQARRYNRLLALMPRLRIRNRHTPRVLQALLKLSQTGADFRLRRRNLQVRSVTVPNAPGVSVRIIHSARPPRALILDFHGGAWVIGNPQLDDVLNAAIIDACNVAVISVDYRLAPAVSMEQVIADCVAAARWVLDDGIGEYAGLPVIVLGESAGAHLAAATLVALRRWPAMLARVAGAVLYYGVYDLTGTPSVHSAGRDTLLFDGPDLRSALARLTPDLDEAGRRAPALSPLYADLSGMPPALLIGAGSDPLRDDTLLMAAHWRQSAPAELQLLPEAPHGFIRLPTTMAALTQAHVHRWITRRIDS